jgi:hypothetical protein
MLLRAALAAALATISMQGVAGFASSYRAAGSFLSPSVRPVTRPFLTLWMANQDDAEAGEANLYGSRLEGNMRAPTPQEISAIDDMITKLSQAKPYELPSAVSKAIRVVSSPRFFLRIAERTDMASSKTEKKQLGALAENLTRVIQAVVSSTEEKLDQCAKNVESVVKASAEPDSGEYLVPLLPERIRGMRKALKNLDPEALDEGFLTTVDAWMNKSVEDGMDGMVAILQKVFQIYAGTQISRARVQLQSEVATALTGESQEVVEEVIAAEQNEQTPASELLEELLHMDTDRWDIYVTENVGEGKVAVSDLLFEVQRTIESIVLGLENGSMAQRVQAEYLKEMLTRVETLK